MIPKTVKIYEVGPRDGLQNEPGQVALTDKISLVNKLSDCGLPSIEAGSFVSPKWVPQMAGSDQVFSGIERNKNISYGALTPNILGLKNALESKVDEVAVFAAASETFSNKNINCSIQESLERFSPVLEEAKKNKLPVRAYVSCVAACPYEGPIAASQVADVAEQLFNMGCYEISLGDTIGAGTAEQIKTMIKTVAERVPVAQLAIHCHDTYGQALANIYAALQCGIGTVDSSVAGLGGCPYAAGASGNVATEDVVYLLDGMGIETGVDLQKTIAAGNFISDRLGRTNQSKVAQALSRT